MTEVFPGDEILADHHNELSEAPTAIAARTTALSINNNTQTDVTLTTEVEDSDSMFAATSAVITVPSGGDGLYDVKAWVVFAAGSTGWRRMGISKNNGTTDGTDNWYVVATTPGVTADCGLDKTIDVRLVAGDTIRMKAWHTQGSALNITYARLSVRKVRD